MQASAHILSENQLPDVPFTPGLNSDKGQPAESRATLAKMHPVRVVIAGGGTGGHLFPGIAIAEEVLSRNEESDILFIGIGNRDHAHYGAPGRFCRG